MAVVFLAVDVPVIMQLDQQSKLENPEVPQFLFIDRVPDIPAATQRRVRAVQNCAENRQDSAGAVLGMIVDAPVVVLRQVLGGSDSTENAGSAAVAVHRRGVVPVELAAASSSSFSAQSEV